MVACSLPKFEAEVIFSSGTKVSRFIGTKNFAVIRERFYCVINECIAFENAIFLGGCKCNMNLVQPLNVYKLQLDQTTLVLRAMKRFPPIGR